MIRKSEWVSIGHPDKTADFISEYLLDRYLEKDPNTRYAVEVQIKDQHVTLAGEVTSTAVFTQADFERFVRNAVVAIGYTPSYAKAWNNQCINPDDLDVRVLISKQSPDIAAGAGDTGWGDQGIFFGYAEYGSDAMLPKDHQLARFIGERLMQRALEAPELGWGLDIKTQVVMPEDSDILDTVIVAIPLMELSEADTVAIYVKVLLGWTPELGPSDFFGTEVIVNGTGAYQMHSSVADCGTTGRKLAVDFYGGNCRIGGGSPWTKDGHYIVLGGNMRREAALHNKETELLCAVLPENTTSQKMKEIALKDNSSFGKFNFEMLRKDWGEFEFQDIGIRFPDAPKGTKKAVEDNYDVSAALKKAGKSTKVKRGDMYRLGDHVLLCGDVTDLNALKKLMGGGNQRI